MNYQLIVLLTTCFILSACWHTGQPTISEDKMADIMTDITLADKIVNYHMPYERDSIKEILRKSLLKVHNVSQAELDTNLYLYMTDIERMESLLEVMKTKSDSLSVD